MANEMKCTLIFQEGGAGWSETVYLNNTSADPDNAREAAELWALRRCGLLAGAPPVPQGNAGLGAVPETGAPPKLQAIRVTNVSKPNVSALFPATAGALDAPKNNPHTLMGTRAALLSLYTANKLHKRTYALRGIPSEWLQGNLNDYRTNKQQANLDKKVKVIISTLLEGIGQYRFCLRVQNWIAYAPPAVVTEVAVDAATGQWLITIPSLTVSLVAGQKIKIVGVRGAGLGGVNGPTMVMYVRGGNRYVINKRPCSSCKTTLYTPGEVYRAGAVTYPEITEGFLTGYSQRATGKRSIRRRGKVRRPVCSL